MSQVYICCGKEEHNPSCNWYHAPRVDATERPEDTARRYAKQLMALKEGLQERKYDLSMVTQDDLVSLALEAIDHQRAEAKANAHMLNEQIALTKAAEDKVAQYEQAKEGWKPLAAPKAEG